MARRRGEADAASDSRLLTLGDSIDGKAPILHALFETVEVGLGRDLEGHGVQAGLVGLAQDQGMAVELVPGLQIDATVRRFGYLGKADTVHVVLDRRLDVENADLGEAGAQDASDSHGCFLRQMLFGLIDFRWTWRGAKRSVRSPLGMRRQAST